MFSETAQLSLFEAASVPIYASAYLQLSIACLRSEARRPTQYLDSLVFLHQSLDVSDDSVCGEATVGSAS